GQLTPVDDLARQLMAFGGELLQHLCGGGPLPGAGLLSAWKAHPAEQDVAELFGRSDGEALAGELIDLVLQPGRALRQLAREPGEDLAIDGNAALLHAAQHRYQRPLQP